MVTKQVACLSLLVPKGPAGARCCKPASYTLPAGTPAPTLPIPVPSAENFLTLTPTVGDRYCYDHPHFQRGRLRSREVRPFHGRAFCQPTAGQQGDTGPVLDLRALLRAADPNRPGQSGTEDRPGAGVPASLQAPAHCCPFLPGSHPHLAGCPAARPRPGGRPAQLKVLPHTSLGSSSGEAKGS